MTASNKGRLPDLVPIRHARMLTSPFAFLRGSAAVMASDLSRTPVTGIRVQACGDCHLMNFGAFATPERRLNFSINDFDETLPAPWEWDVKRPAASFAVAGRHLDLAARDAQAAAEGAARAYRRAMVRYAGMHAFELWYDHVEVTQVLSSLPTGAHARVSARVEKVRARNVVEHAFPKLAEQDGGPPRIRHDPPLMFHLRRHQRKAARGNILRALRCTEARSTTTTACSSTASSFTTSPSRSSAWEAWARHAWWRC